MISGTNRFQALFKGFFILVMGAVFLAGCATHDPRLSDALRGTRVAEVRVESTPDVTTGLPMINGKTPQEQVAIVVTALKKVASRELVGYPGGPNSARLVITLQHANLASEQGRVILSSDSTITGTVRLEDIKTGRLIAQNPRVVGENSAVKGQGVAGMAIAFAVNAAMTKSQEHLAEKLAVSFTKNAKNWLTPR
ncbi:hypothetical protein ACLBWS_12235 [Brucellaceae bacterium D45D]